MTIHMSTHRATDETLNDSKRFGHLIDDARTQLAENYPDADAESILVPVESLARSRRFWQFQGDGLVVFSSPDGMRRFRTDRSFPKDATVGDSFNFRHVLPLVTGEVPFVILAISRAKVRLFEADRAHVTELPLGDIPASEDDVAGAYTREPELQSQGSTGRHALYHGHGTGEDNVLEAFLRVTGRAVEKRFSNDKRPLVLASVQEYLGLLSTHINNVRILGVAPGNPDELDAKQIHEKAWPLGAGEVQRHTSVLTDDYAAAIGTGLATANPEYIVNASEVGRIGTLMVTEQALDQPAYARDLDDAICNVLHTSGEVWAVDELNDGNPFGALRRY
ncbi:hypothetical protein [Corynebacterium sp. HMSC11E11]|uniref:baeRF3 domain-containing protein n=1 Tax=Corynebacterium sp. HMSC11E11 TaxID=1581089 RepID=UPI0008D1621F|nr:hypothetical protein [Corynebacterium sp. HMSC11E11]OFU57154.1 hypothetical protein HMPREF3121_03550 [Corynebacterium sp. HMSC11E11]